VSLLAGLQCHLMAQLEKDLPHKIVDRFQFLMGYGTEDFSFMMAVGQQSLRSQDFFHNPFSKGTSHYFCHFR
jgi:hypothetical protein